MNNAELLASILRSSSIFGTFLRLGKLTLYDVFMRDMACLDGDACGTINVDTEAERDFRDIVSSIKTPAASLPLYFPRTQQMGRKKKSSNDLHSNKKFMKNFVAPGSFSN